MIAPAIAVSAPGMRRETSRVASTTAMTPADMTTSQMWALGSAISSRTNLITVPPGPARVPVTVTPNMSGSWLTATWMPTPVRNPDQHGARQEVREESEPDQPGQQQQPAGQQGGEPGQ